MEVAAVAVGGLSAVSQWLHHLHCMCGCKNIIVNRIKNKKSCKFCGQVKKFGKVFIKSLQVRSRSLLSHGGLNSCKGSRNNRTMVEARRSCWCEQWQWSQQGLHWSHLSKVGKQNWEINSFKLCVRQSLCENKELIWETY